MAKKFAIVLAMLFGLAVVSMGQVGAPSGTSITRARSFLPFLDIGSGKFTVSSAGLLTTYEGVATAGLGVTPIWGVASLTGQVAAIGATTLKATGATPGAGLYSVNAYLTSTVICATPGPAVVGLAMGWTDETGAHAAQTIPVYVNGSATAVTTMGLGNATNYAYGTANVYAAATTNIQYSTSYVACTTGTGTYTLRVALEQLL